MTYTDIVEKLEKISHNNKDWSNRKSDTGRSTFEVQATHDPTANEICEEMAQMIDKLWLVLRHFTRGAEKVNGVNYLRGY